MGTPINFFWYGDNFHYLNYITIKSHIYVGHSVIIHLYGNEPESGYWNKIKNDITITDTKNTFDINKFISDGGNIKTASDLWRFIFLYENGGWYSDCDAFAITQWDKIETPWMLCSGETKKDTLSIGVIKAPPKEQIFLNCIKNIKHVWGNVDVFSDAYNKNKEDNAFNISPTIYDPKCFYPVVWNEYYKLLDNITIPKESYSVHLFNTMFERKYDIKQIEQIITSNKQSILYKLCCHFC